MRDGSGDASRKAAISRPRARARAIIRRASGAASRSLAADSTAAPSLAPVELRLSQSERGSHAPVAFAFAFAFAMVDGGGAGKKGLQARTRTGITCEPGAQVSLL